MQLCYFKLLTIIHPGKGTEHCCLPTMAELSISTIQLHRVTYFDSFRPLCFLEGKARAAFNFLANCGAGAALVRMQWS